MEYNALKGLLIARATVIVELHRACAALKDRLLKLIDKRHAPALEAILDEHEEQLRKRIDHRSGGEPVEIDEPAP